METTVTADISKEFPVRCDYHPLTLASLKAFDSVAKGFPAATVVPAASCARVQRRGESQLRCVTVSFSVTVDAIEASKAMEHLGLRPCLPEEVLDCIGNDCHHAGHPMRDALKSGVVALGATFNEEQLFMSCGIGYIGVPETYVALCEATRKFKPGTIFPAVKEA